MTYKKPNYQCRRTVIVANTLEECNPRLSSRLLCTWCHNNTRYTVALLFFRGEIVLTGHKVFVPKVRFENWVTRKWVICFWSHNSSRSEGEGGSFVLGFLWNACELENILFFPTLVITEETCSVFTAQSMLIANEQTLLFFSLLYFNITLPTSTLLV